MRESHESALNSVFGNSCEVETRFFDLFRFCSVEGGLRPQKWAPRWAPFPDLSGGRLEIGEPQKSFFAKNIFGGLGGVFAKSSTFGSIGGVEDG